MGNNNILPRGGFLRGVLAGLILIFFAFVGLSVLFPLPKEIASVPTPMTELNNTRTIPELEPEDSSGGISVLMETPTSGLAPETPTAFSDTAPVVVIEPSAAEPITSVSVLESMSTSNDIQVGADESSSTIANSPVVPTLEVEPIEETQVVEDVTETSDLVSTPIEAPLENEVEEVAEVEIVESVVEPAEGLELSGQTLIQPDEPEEVPNTAPEKSISAFIAYSADFIDENKLPLMSVILLVTTINEAQTVASLPAPLTVAVASSNPDAGEIIETYRTLGGEVVLLLPTEGENYIGKGSDSAKVSDNLEAVLANTDGAIGILDGPEGSVNQDNRVLEAIFAKLSETGHALITVDGLGLNRASVMASESNIPATGISNIIDTSQGTIAVVRELDKVVLQIGDQRAVTAFAAATPDMLFGLNFWLESQKAQLVTVAPVSASIGRN